MNRAVFLKEIREARWKLVVGTGILSVLAVALSLSFNFIRELFLQVPPGFQWFERMMPPGMLENYTVFLWSQWNGKNLAQLGTLLAILLGMGTIAGEVSSQTISFLLTRPLSRRSVFISKVTAGIFILTLAVTVSTSLMLVAALIFSAATVEIVPVAVATMITLLGLILIYSLTVFMSAIVDDPVKAGGITVFILVGFSILGWFDATRILSPFFHLGGGTYMIGGFFPLGPVIVMGLLTVALLAAGTAILEKKEI